MLAGRAAELDRIRAALEAARAGSARALLVTGDAGIGKTALLTAAAAVAGDFRRLSVRGVESEARLEHAGLLALLRPLQPLARTLAPPLRATLAAVLGEGAPEGGRPPDRYLTGVATLTVLSAAADTRPVLVTVDDLHWVDRESAQALLFAARRASADRLVLLLTARTGAALPVEADGLDRLALAGVPAGAVRELVPGTSPAVAARLAEATGGNPLALVEAAAGLTQAQRVGAAPLPESLPAGGELLAGYRDALAGLGPGARSAALLLAAAPEGADRAVADALRADGTDPAVAVDELDQRGIVHRVDGELRFRHPLVRTAAWQLASAAARRRAHAALAQALPAGAPERLRHRAAAVTGYDDDLAVELAAAAAASRARLGHAAAAELLERAAGLAGDPAAASRHLAAAVEDACLAGDGDRARALAARLLDRSPGADGDARATALHALGLLEEFAGSVTRATELQAEAARSGRGRVRARALAQLGLLRYRWDDAAGMREVAAELAATADRTDPEQDMLAAYLAAAAASFAGDAPAARAQMLRAVALLEGDPGLRADPRHLLLAVIAGRWMGDVAGSGDLVGLDRRLQAARERGALGVLVPALALVAAGRALLGDHTEAYAAAGESVELGEALGHVSELALARLVLAVEAALRGRAEEADGLVAAARGLVERAGTAAVAEHLAVVEATCALSAGDLPRVVATLEPVVARPGGHSGHVGDRLPAAPLLVEALVGLRRGAEAADLADRYGAANPPPRPPAVRALVGRCAGLVAEPARADVAFADALAAHAAWPEPFEEARTRLLRGAALRRAGQRLAAREELRRARGLFAADDLAAWTARADAELAATGETARRRPAGEREPLTSQETRVALLVARGLTNREVAAALFLSPRTVEHHLGRVLRKHGLRSRTELAHHLREPAP
ncbi:helix-turn-helix transcriptional regulator [Trujillonella humicola]|uniref:helix-turn-helix transcriptional regulator n=1 Tax=Trujillonella humicola TaxID=3383699 RepID=UPI003905A6BA